MPLLMHGDAAFAGQGVVAECFGLSDLKGYRTGGSIHFIVNNQIGFTTIRAIRAPRPFRPTSPDDRGADLPRQRRRPEAVTFAAKVATNTAEFERPVVIDMFCYRRFGHNEGDEPSFTQPLMYQKIRAHPPTLEIYSKKLIGEGVVTGGEVDKLKADGAPGSTPNTNRRSATSRQGRLARRPLVGASRPRMASRTAPRQYRRRYLPSCARSAR